MVSRSGAECRGSRAPLRRVVALPLLLGACVTLQQQPETSAPATPSVEAPAPPASESGPPPADSQQANLPPEQLAYAPGGSPEPGLTPERLRVFYQRGLKARDRRIYDVAFDYFRRASDGGYGLASLAAGKSLAAGFPGLPQDFALAAAYYRLAVERGAGYLAALPLGALYQQGLGVPQSAAEAQRWFRRGAFTLVKLDGVVKRGGGANEPGGAARLIATLFSPHAVPKAFGDALAWVQALDRRDGESIYVESLQYRDGDGVAQDMVLADLLLEAAARRGYPQAAYEIGLAKLEGGTGAQDFSTGLVLLWQAAQGGLIVAQTALAQVYREADGDDLDEERAYYWLLRARQRGGEVESELAAVAAELSEEKRAQVARNLESDFVYPP